MKAETKRRFFVALAVLIGIPTALCITFVVLLIWGLCFGEDPLEAPIQKDHVSAMMCSQRMGDQRFYVFLENHNNRQVAVDLNMSLVNHTTQSIRPIILHAVLNPHSTKRIYPDNPSESPYEILSLSVK